MKILFFSLIIFLIVFGRCSYAALTESERSHLRQMSLTFCECRAKTWAIAFDKDKPLAKVFCRNGESKVFYVTDKYEVCK